MPYISILQAAEAEFIEKKSRFIGRAFPVLTQVEAETILARIRSEEPGATHHCMAYVIGSGGELKKADDNGEPQGTAGMPILHVLEREDLVNVLVIVTRYFGGIKLGAPGLIRAYTKGSKIALDAATVVHYRPFKTVQAEYAYAAQGKIDYELAEVAADPPVFAENVKRTYYIPSDDVDKIKETLLHLTSGSLTWVVGEEKECPVDTNGRLLKRK